MQEGETAFIPGFIISLFIYENLNNYSKRNEWDGRLDLGCVSGFNPITYCRNFVNS